MNTMERTGKPKTETLWRKHDLKAQKSGQRGTIYWVGKSIIGEDGSRTGERSKGASYHGEWSGDKKSGYGVQVYPNGEKYEGQFGQGLRNGEGTLWVPVGKALKLRKNYVGGWKDDKQHGKGTCFFKNGELFQGFWDNGKMHGAGTLRYGNGDMYIGEWHDGLRSGQGTLNRANGDCYEGYWLNDKREGSGSHFYAESGKVFVGEWADDVPKAGVFTQASSNPEQATKVPTTTVLPPVRLALPADVLENALAAVRGSRKAFRAKATPIARLFAENEVVALRAAFENVQRVDGTIAASDLQGLCTHLGAEVPMSRLRRLLADAGFASHGTDVDEDASYRFDEFLRIIALLLDEESATNAEPATNEFHMDSTADFWGEDEYE